MDMKNLLERMKQNQKPQPSPELQKFIERIKQRKAELDEQKKQTE